MLSVSPADRIFILAGAGAGAESGISCTERRDDPQLLVDTLAVVIRKPDGNAGGPLPIEADEKITITKHGAPVAKLVPVKKEVSAEQRVAAIQRIQQLAAGLSLCGLKVKDLINEGHR